MCLHATVAIGGVLRLPSSIQFHHVGFLRFRRPTGARAISVPSGRANDRDHPVAAFEGGADFIVPLPRSARGGVADVGVRCGSGSLRRSARPAGRRCRRSGAGRFQKTPSGVIQGFHFCGTNRGTTFLIYCFYWDNVGVVVRLKVNCSDETGVARTHPPPRTHRNNKCAHQRDSWNGEANAKDEPGGCRERVRARHPLRRRSDARGIDGRRMAKVSGHYEPWLRDPAQCGGGSWWCGPRSDRRGSSANSDFHIRGVSSMARLAGCTLMRWSTSTR